MRDATARAAQRPRIFVSSVIEGFAEVRQAARGALAAAGGFSSLTSIWNACLDAVDGADSFVSIVGQLGGWTTPCGKLIIEKEYDRATARKLPVLVFLQHVDRDIEGTCFARQLSDCVDGAFGRTIARPDELP